jgi:hypothetical protein
VVVVSIAMPHTTRRHRRVVVPPRRRRRDDGTHTTTTTVVAQVARPRSCCAYEFSWTDPDDADADSVRAPSGRGGGGGDGDGGDGGEGQGVSDPWEKHYPNATHGGWRPRQRAKLCTDNYACLEVSKLSAQTNAVSHGSAIVGIVLLRIPRVWSL